VLAPGAPELILVAPGAAICRTRTVSGVGIIGLRRLDGDIVQHTLILDIERRREHAATSCIRDGYDPQSSCRSSQYRVRDQLRDDPRHGRDCARQQRGPAYADRWLNKITVENMEQVLQPRHFQPGEGKTFRIGRMTVTFKTTADQGWNAYTVCEAIEPPESGAGYHRHPTYDETFVICEGHYDFRLDAKLLELGPGDVVFVPRGTPHGFVSKGPEVGRQLIISSPGGIFDAMVAEMATLDTGSPTRQASQDAKAIAAKHGLEFLPS